MHHVVKSAFIVLGIVAAATLGWSRFTARATTGRQQGVPSDTTVRPTALGEFNVRVVEDHGRRFFYQVHLPLHLPAGNHQPVIIALHGSGEKGSDNIKQTRIGFGDIIRSGHSVANAAIIILPQNPETERGPSFSTAVVRMLDATLAEFDCDPKRVYLTGISYGGVLAFDLAYRYPERFAALVPVSSDISTGWITDRSDAPRDSVYALVAPHLRSIPVWMFHGALDPSVPPANARRIARALEVAGVNVRYTEYPGQGHSIWTQVYSTPDLYSWMFTQHR